MNSFSSWWQESLSQLNYDADIAFFGDSITAAGRWQEWFPDYKIINLGVSANSPEDMHERIDMVYSVRPEKVFIMGGINGITRVTIKPYVERYSSIIEDLQKNLPDVQIFIQSVLPISPEKGRKNNITNEVICNYNNELMKIAEKQGCVYIDLHSLYEKDGIMNPELTTDGVHLTNDAYLYWINAIRPYIEE